MSQSSYFNTSGGSALQYFYIAGAATTQVKSGSGFLHSIVINNPAAGATITVIDGTSGSSASIALIASTVCTTLVYDLKFTTGLRIITAGATDITVVYK